MIYKLAFYSLAMCTLALFASLGSASAQIKFGKPTPETALLQTSVNECATQQEMTMCLNALSLAQMLRKADDQADISADSIMIDAVELLPLYMLSQPYLRNADKSSSCEYGRAGEALIDEISGKMEKLEAREPGAFKTRIRLSLRLAIWRANSRMCKPIAWIDSWLTCALTRRCDACWGA